MRKIAYVGIGSNLGDKKGNCLKAVGLIERISGLRVEARSDFFVTEPIGVEGQDWFVNAVIAVSTEKPARNLLKILLSVEADMGRKRKEKWDPRIIDLDILLFGHDVIEEEGLTVPHPLMHLRRFVLVPMVQLAPDLIHPALGKTMFQLNEDLPEEGQAVTGMGKTDGAL
ncbi:MAG: 2-amino-4-hydroxy-6-hydroxymethyldihydropteridine diphosphokinase [Thermodesulfobacteriota bacterium]|nr:2-amino-4-hydroxy-6-hydroxymethyldihydropteridine diphosphokinase [Thermodesulfobacteriota bacterium]